MNPYRLSAQRDRSSGAKLKSLRVSGMIALAGASLVAGSVATATTAAASTAAPASVAQVCATEIAHDGGSVRGACQPGSGGNHFRLVITICGTSSCQQARGPWWPRDSVFRTWDNSGFAARVDTIEFTTL